MSTYFKEKICKIKQRINIVDTKILNKLMLINSSTQKQANDLLVIYK